MDQISHGEHLVLSVKEAVEKLCECRAEEEERVGRVVVRLEEAFEAVCEKVCILYYSTLQYSTVQYSTAVQCVLFTYNFILLYVD